MESEDATDAMLQVMKTAKAKYGQGAGEAKTTPGPSPARPSTRYTRIHWRPGSGMYKVATFRTANMLKGRVMV